MRKLYSLFLLISLASFSSNVVGQYVTNGDASDLGGNEFQLTPDLFSQGGSVWYQTRLDLRYNFEINVQLNLGKRTLDGADGIAFVLQPLSSDLGGIGGGIGYQGIDPSLAVEFDTWQNPGPTEANDPPEDHLAFMRNGNTQHLSTDNPLPPYLLPEIEDGTYQNATFTWNATAHTLTVNYRGLTFVLTEDIITTIFGGSPYVYWGFTAATGAARNDQRVKIGATSFVEEISITGTVTNASCTGSSDGAVDITVTGGVPPYTFSWSNGAITEDISGVPAGTYTVKVTDAQGVTQVATFTVGEDPDTEDPDISCPIDQVFCKNATGMYNIPELKASDNCGTPGSSFEITGATTRSGTGTNASGSFNEGTSTIEWTVTDGSGNTSTCKTQVTVNSNPTLTIPDVFAVNPGGSPNTIFIGFGPTSLTLTATPTGGTPPYTVTWSTGETGESITVSPGTVGCITYTATVTDAAGCTGTASKTICVVDVRCGNNLDKVIVCHVPPGNPENAHEICISPNAVQTHLTQHGDKLGPCGSTQAPATIASKQIPILELGLERTVHAFPNPGIGQFELQLNNYKSSKAEVTVVNSLGATIERRIVQLSGKSQMVKFNLQKQVTGMYLVKVIADGKVQTTKVMIQR